MGFVRPSQNVTGNPLKPVTDKKLFFSASTGERNLTQSPPRPGGSTGPGPARCLPGPADSAACPACIPRGSRLVPPLVPLSCRYSVTEPQLLRRTQEGDTRSFRSNDLVFILEGSSLSSPVLKGQVQRHIILAICHRITVCSSESRAQSSFPSLTAGYGADDFSSPWFASGERIRAVKQESL